MHPSFATRANLDLLEQNYQRWQENPASLDAAWLAFFEGFELGDLKLRNGAAAAASAPALTEPGDQPLQTRVDGLVYAYRTLGHTIARIDPLATKRPANPLLSLRELGFSEKDLDLVVSSKFFLDARKMTLREMIALLENIYADSIGSEFQHIQNPRIRNWVRHRLESRPDKHGAARETELGILRTLLEAETFETFLHTRYVGQKRFSLQGAEALMVILDSVLQRCPRHGIEEICMGMAHRGRLNVLANFLKKSLQIIFTEFSTNYIPDLVAGDGDVKYHLGYRTVRKLEAGAEVEIRLAANPSHLEAVNPVVEGTARARQRIRGDTEHRRKVLPVLIHGDAAFAGQGIVAETLNMSQLHGYGTGGTIHIVVNNQIGFTTLPEDARSSMYATDIAKMIEVPIFHVNGDDPLAVVFVTELALDFRQEFGRDAVIDMYCYRRYGHNEGDEPSFTQPDLYAKIQKRPPVAQLFKKELIDAKKLSADEAASLEAEFEMRLELVLQEVKSVEAEEAGGKDRFQESTAVFQPQYTSDCQPTSISADMLKQIVDGLTRVPEDFEVIPKIKKNVLDRRREIFEAGGPYEWHYAEALAFGSLLLEGTPVRLSGQDSRRGTFSTRHSFIYDAKSGRPYMPLLHLAEKQARICIYNSLLSEAAVLGFDYGYSLDYPNMLCLWEAQFGDFANGAQVIIDQFIVPAESKWQRPSGIVLLLPHGYEGQGPEHSSARLERFLQAAAEENIQVCNVTTSAQYFHVLRRQMKRDFVKPLVIMTPKSLLRAEHASSRAEEFTEGGFSEVLGSPEVGPSEKIKRVILCSGKVYYDLLNYRDAENITNAAIVRVEQLYPLAESKLREALAPYPKNAKLIWCQEESQNMGAWTFMEPRLWGLFGRKIIYAGRNASASPAVGSLAVHKREQAQLIADAFSL
ncbi:MAG TPA: 2-oxoglutarate dehydrogenase E1 component [Chthoniobacterales bacterium]|jgi:2-oxoglutarate dehydrogenase E1 component|nr:2-oxoglutarate dehydrogenase E1 component [Chthoniobacterales bacterium]